MEQTELDEPAMAGLKEPAEQAWTSWLHLYLPALFTAVAKRCTVRDILIAAERPTP
jgi:hypothetical protein